MLRELEEHLHACPHLGIIGTFLQEARPESDQLMRLAVPAEHVHGATKFYRRDCWDDISPQPAILGWDSIDERSARHAGWETRSIALSQGDPVHLRPRKLMTGGCVAYAASGSATGPWANHPCLCSG